MSSVASGNSPPAKASGERRKVSAKARAKPNEGKTGLSRRWGNEISSASKANANSGTNNSRVSVSKAGKPSNNRASETSVNRAVINSEVNVRANGTSSSKANGMGSKAASLAPRH